MAQPRRWAGCLEVTSSHEMCHHPDPIERHPQRANRCREQAGPERGRSCKLTGDYHHPFIDRDQNNKGVNGLQARTFGVWTLLSSVIRCACAVDIRNKTLYHITLWTFVLALGHFLSEVCVYHTAEMTIGVMAPLMVSSFSILGMMIGFQYLEILQENPVPRNKKRN